MSVTLEKQYGLFVGGDFVKGTGEDFIESFNPANGEKLAEFTNGTKEDVDGAVKVAHEAFKSWKKVGIEARSAMLLKIADIIDENREHLAMVETLDNGKPIRETLAVDITLAADHFRYFAGVIRSEEGSVQALNENQLSMVIREPIGVVGQIIPWNFPFLMAAWKIAPALATGNTIIINPSSTTSLSILELARLTKDVIPKGVFNVVTGRGRTTGSYILNHPDIQKLAFTGSTDVGYTVAKAAAEKLIPATLELGGKSANIFFDDMPYEKALEGAQMGILFNQGQVCCAGSRIFVQEGIYDQFVADLVKAFEKVKVGKPWEADTQMGAQINQGQLEGILDYVEIGVKEGATLLTGGKRKDIPGLEKGCFMEPTLLANANNDMRVSQEEIFGPVAVVIKFKTIEEVLEMANDSEFGLGGGVWTRDINKALRVSREIETGRIWVNTYNQIPAGAPFGGVKKSGIGRETYKTMIDSYSQMKNIFIDISDQGLGMY